MTPMLHSPRGSSARFLSSSSLWVLTFHGGSFAPACRLRPAEQEVTPRTPCMRFALSPGVTTAMMMVQVTVLQTMNGGTPRYGLGRGVSQSTAPVRLLGVARRNPGHCQIALAGAGGGCLVRCHARIQHGVLCARDAPEHRLAPGAGAMRRGGNRHHRRHPQEFSLRWRLRRRLHVRLYRPAGRRSALVQDLRQGSYQLPRPCCCGGRACGYRYPRVLSVVWPARTRSTTTACRKQDRNHRWSWNYNTQTLIQLDWPPDSALAHTAPPSAG